MKTTARMQPKFKPWVPIWDRWNVPKVGTVMERGEVLAKMIRKHRPKDLASVDRQFMADWRWDYYKRPSYKVWSQIADAMAHISIDIDSELFFEPYPTYSILLPMDYAETIGLSRPTFLVEVNRQWDLTGSDKPTYSGPFESRSEQQQAAIREEIIRERGGPIAFTLKVYFAQREGGKEGGHAFQCHVVKGATIQRAMEIEAGLHGCNDPLRWMLFSIAIAVGFFGVDNHEVVCPDIKKPIIDCNCRQNVLRMREEKAAQKYARQVEKCREWRVGSEIDLPRPEFINRGDVRNGTGTALTASHIRSGHLRLQRCGPGLKDRKVIFLMPTIVRPDLPFQQSRGYRIRGSEKTAAV